MNTKISYTYRDVNNYKQHEEIIVSGTVVMAELQSCCAHEISGSDDFLPEQVGLNALQSRMIDGACSDQDCVWHELTDAEPTEEDAGWISAEDLLAAFRRAKGKWDVAKEMEAAGLL
jgi:hypothetical protein